MQKKPSRGKLQTRSELGSKARPSPARAHGGAPNPRRVAAGKLNRAKWKGISPAGMRRLRRAAAANQPWLHATGPRTAAGKVKAARNGSFKQVGPKSVRSVKRELHELRGLLNEMQAARAAIGFGDA